MSNQEWTKGGSQILRYNDETGEKSELVAGDEKLIEKITNHIRSHLGEIEEVIHQIISYDVHIDIHIVPPQKDKNYYTLVTSGMSQKPMLIRRSDDDSAEDIEIYAELILSLPPEWQLSEESWKNQRHYWPVEWLSRLARFPHEYKTYFLEGHTIPNGDPAEYLAQDTDFIGFIIGFPCLVPEDFTWRKEKKKTTIFFALYPLYQDEMDYKLNEGSEKLFELFEKHNVTELVDINRNSVLKNLKGQDRMNKLWRFLKRG